MAMILTDYFESNDMAATVTIDELNDMTRVLFVGALGEIFEMSPWIAEAAWEARPFGSAVALWQAMMDVVTQAGRERQVALLRAHPDLGGKAARVAAMTEHSNVEQSGAGLDRLDDAEFERFHELNDAYRDKFGFPFIIAVKDYDKAGILAAFEVRLQNGADEELTECLIQVGRIAELRLTATVV